MIFIRKSCIILICFTALLLSSMHSVEARVLSNEKITVAVGNQQSWTGRNGTGNLSYYGCDQNCQCTYLTGGKLTCRNGTCQTTWQNKNDVYILSSAISQQNVTRQTPSTLTILSGDRVVLEQKIYPKTFDNLNLGD